MAELLAELARLDNLKLLAHAPCPGVIHQDHRWTLPLIFHAQEQNFVPRPCRVMSFDAHLDSRNPMAVPDSSAAIARLKGKPLDARALIDLCQNHLNILDDDWLKAAMALGLVSDAVVYGSRDRQEVDCFSHDNVDHLIIPCHLPATSLAYQGDLCDSARASNPKLQQLWKVVGWMPGSERYTFSEGSDRFVITIDLDCFACDWGDYLFPWPERVYRGEFCNPTHARWTGREFFRGLVERAGFLDVAREPKHCGGEQDADRIFHDVNRILFDGHLGIREVNAAN